MNINEIITETEYTKERPTEELLGWMALKDRELELWAKEHSGTEALRAIKHKELSKGLPCKFTHELTPFAHYAKNYYGVKSNVRFRPCCGSEQYDGIIIDDEKKVFVEITNAIDGEKWGLQKELLTAEGHSPWEYNICGVKENKTKRKRSASDIITNDEVISAIDHINKIKNLVKETTLAKFKKSVNPELPYGQNSTILIVAFDDTGFGPYFNEKKQWGDLIDFKRKKMGAKHNFKKIILYGWLNKKFID